MENPGESMRNASITARPEGSLPAFAARTPAYGTARRRETEESP
jgi:hypothetical protein